MKLISKMSIAVLFLTLAVACKDTKKEEDTVVKAVIEKVEAVETELETVTEELQKEATSLEDSLNALDDI